MEQIVRDVKLRQVAPGVPHFGSPSPLLFITLLLVVSFSASVVTVNTLAKRLGNNRLPDPLAAFADVFPGQYLDAHMLETEGFSCYVDTQPSPADIIERCSRVFQTGTFSQISVTIWDGIVKWLYLSLHEHSLNVGDLALLWGNPELRMNGAGMDVSWPDRRITGSGRSLNGRFTYFVLVSHLWLD